MKYFIETLGCDKNTADSRNLGGILESIGIEFSNNPLSAQLIFINTCGFIESAKEESIENILKYGKIKKNNPEKKIIVFGCLSERYQDELTRQIPEIDIFLGVFDNIKERIESILKRQGLDISNSRAKYINHQGVVGYLKIADGCNRRCSFCSIPLIKGNYKSRSKEEILIEGKKLFANGVRELVLVAQDTSDYGCDLKEDINLAKLLDEISEIPFKWIRLLYIYPNGINDELLEIIKKKDNILKYLDIPLQHGSNRILKSMGRGETRRVLVDKIDYIKKEIPDITIRSTFIVGYPNETDDDFDELITFLEEIELHWAGAFTYSREEGTKAFVMDGQIPQEIKDERYKVLMETQKEITTRVNESFIGKLVDVLVEEEIEEGLYLGRPSFSTEEVDGSIYIEGNDLELMSFIKVRVKEVIDYDLRGVVYELGK